MTLKHGHRKSGSTSAVYGVWAEMRHRCRNPKHPEYKNYGARGITVCDRWHKFETFLADMGEPNGLTLERINNDGNYEPSNCRWATQQEQCQNTRLTHRLTFEGETLSLSSWARRVGIPRETLHKRINHGWPLELALSTKRNHHYQRQS